MERIAIIGAGPAGCSAAYHLRKQGHEVTLFESAPIVGGRTQGYRADERTLDTGAAFFTNFYPRVLKLLDELGLKPKIKALNRVTGLYHDGHISRLNISSSLSFLRFPLVKFSDKLKMGWWILKLTLKRRRFDLADPRRLALQDERTVGDYSREVLNHEIYDILIRPGIEPFWYFSCEEISEGLLLALSAHAAGAKFYFLSGGIDQLCQRLASSVTLKLNAEVTSIESEGEMFSVCFQQNQSELSGDGSPLEEARASFDRVIIATPAQVAQSLIKDVPHAQVDETQRAFLASQKYVANLHVTFKLERLDQDPRCSSILPCGSGEHPFAAICFHHALDYREPQLVSVYLSGPESDRLMELSDEALYTQCERLIDEVFPHISGPKAPFHLIRRASAIPIHEVGRYKSALEFHQAQRLSRVQFCGDYLCTSTIEGAVSTGIMVSEMVADQAQR